MSQALRFIGRRIDENDEFAEIVCRSASALALPSRRAVGVGNDVESSRIPTAIILQGVEPEGLAVVRKGGWTHVHWLTSSGEPGRELPIWRIFMEGENVRVLV